MPRKCKKDYVICFNHSNADRSFVDIMGNSFLKYIEHMKQIQKETKARSR